MSRTFHFPERPGAYRFRWRREERELRPELRRCASCTTSYLGRIGDGYLCPDCIRPGAVIRFPGDRMDANTRLDGEIREGR